MLGGLGGQGNRLLHGADIGAGGGIEFVGHNQEGLGEIQALIARVDRDSDEVGTTGNLIVVQPLVLATEDDGHRGLRGQAENLRCQDARRLDGGAVEPAARGGADDGRTIRDGLVEGRDLTARVQNVRGMDGQAVPFFPTIQDTRGDEGQFTESHVRHGAADAADVSGVQGADEDDGDIVKRIHGIGSKRVRARAAMAAGQAVRSSTAQTSRGPWLPRVGNSRGTTGIVAPLCGKARASVPEKL